MTYKPSKSDQSSSIGRSSHAGLPMYI